jgi:Fe-S cluster assembly ATP-binding protein
MGPNGSGKSTLANILLGHPSYEVTAGKIFFDGDDVTEAAPTDRAQRGMFLAFQYPEEIPGVSVIQFLRQALSNRTGVDYTVLELRLRVMEAMKDLGMESSFADRYLNEGFSGGERKRNEVLQMAVLEPLLAVMDETDSGLDVDALRTVAEGIRDAGIRHELHDAAAAGIANAVTFVDTLARGVRHAHRLILRPVSASMARPQGGTDA